MKKRAVLLSVQPRWCAEILNGRKTAEIRKSRPQQETPFKVYIYCTKQGRPLVFGDIFTGDWEMEYTQTYNWSREDADRIWGVMNGKVIAEFTCDRIQDIDIPYPAYASEIDKKILREACLEVSDLYYYSGSDTRVRGWHISDLVIYDKPKELSDFQVKRPPQSWMYVEEMTADAE